MSASTPEGADAGGLTPFWHMAGLFLLLGTVAFGGPAAHVALMRRLMVERYGWVSEAEFFELFAACSLIPGPSSTELAILLGYKRGGKLGLLLAGLCFILPAMLIMLGLAILYKHFSSTAVARHILMGITVVVVGILAWAVTDIGRRILSGRWKWGLCSAVAIAALVSVAPIALLLVSGALAYVTFYMRQGEVDWPSIKRPLLFLPLPVGVVVWRTKLTLLFATFLKIGFVSFGSGYVLLALLRSELVLNLHWLTQRQVLDAVAISQVTPGPVFTTATFIGYLVEGIPGAVAATAAIFAPAFLFVPPLERFVRWVAKHPALREALAAVNVAALGLIIAVSLDVGHVAILSPAAGALALLTFLLLLREPLAAPLAVIAGGLAGIAVPGALH